MDATTTEFTQKLSSHIPEQFNMFYLQLFIYFLACWFLYWGFVTLVFNLFVKRYIKSSAAAFEFTCNDTINRFVSTTNGHICIFYPLWNIIAHPAGFNEPNNDIEQKFMMYFAAYNIYDTFACWWLKVDDTKLYIHHLAT